MSEERIWLKSYPEDMPHDIDLGLYTSLADMMEKAFARHQGKVGYHFMGRDITFDETATYAHAIAAFLQSLGLVKGDRVALMMPNIPQYPEVVCGTIEAGCVVVNVNPLYTPRELEHQLKDCGAKVIFIVENMAHTLEQCIANTAVEHVITTSVGDRLKFFQRLVVNTVVRRSITAFNLPNAITYAQAVSRGKAATFKPVPLAVEDLAVLQYTGGTTGVSKGAMLLHGNLIANALQIYEWNEPARRTASTDEQYTMVAALPLYHIFGFTACMMIGLHSGSKCILIPNPRDMASMLKTLSTQRFHDFPAVNTLFNGILHHPDFDKVDWSCLRVTVGGGMAVQRVVAQQWL
jgi:long-chain acyl-CoA synthetase